MGIEEFLLDQAKNEGIEKGKQEEARVIAIELKKEGLTIEFIAKTTKLSIEEIERL
jgi:predicted transposase/invertase (TIGR01784 family)